MTSAAPAAAQDWVIGEIFLFGGNFCPRNTALANGALMAISQNTALFSIVGTTFGGDGRTTFGLPDLQGRVPMGVGTGPGLSPRFWGQKVGAETHTLTVSEIPAHNHLMRVSTENGDKQRPANDYLARPNVNETLPPEDRIKMYADELPVGPDNYMEQDAITNTGGNLPHSNMQPSLAAYYCIVVNGIYPSRS
ncbi:hypothetical protein BOO69_05170 [Sulfitobacter alexandrii]|uniref:Phage tail collar domain-containing protein n=2 Tax=Sulfitobacter alexandrii TaxID=1917485 RepID=A0A1J0WLQ5_9RHOB|nr:hypothetical protein BOO69_05170 [Sulfitobacter alexandrii]